MKSKFFIILLTFFCCNNLIAENLSIVAKNITFNKDKNITIFEKEVVVETKNKTIKSDYVEYHKEDGFLIVKKNIIVVDDKNNNLQAEHAEYFEKDQILITKGKTKIFTSEKYTLNGEDITMDNKNKIITSNKNSILLDQDGNKVFLDNFEYSIDRNLFKSVGYVKIEDLNKNIYEFSQIYIDTKKKEILGTDTKSYLNQEEFKINEKNKPRIFANTINIKKEKSSFEKSVFTLCDYRKNDKCPPWTIQSRKMLHDNIKKTIYYENAVVKVYNIPIFYFPRLSHPDPSVDRRSGFLPPTLYNSKNLGNGISVPYFFNLGVDKNLTITNRFYFAEHPLILGEYHQAFKNSDLITDFGYTEGYKKTSSTKRSGEKSHFFARFVKNFTNSKNFENNFNINLQEVSNDKYLKLYKIESNLVDYNLDTLENSLNYTLQKDDLFFGFDASVYESLKDNYEDKYEYILPEITFNKNLFLNEDLGSLSLQSNYKVHNYDTNKLTNFLVNDFEWTSNDLNLKNGVNTKFLANVKNINYESKNVDVYKKDPTVEIYGALGLLSEVNLLKNTNNSEHLLKPKMLVRLSPGSMRKESSGSRLNPISAFNLNRVSNKNNFESGLNATIGFDYKIDNNNGNDFDFSVAQIINEKENKKMSDTSSLNEKLSDLVGSSSYALNKNFKLNYNFSVDQNYNDINYNEIGTNFNNELLDINFDYLRESKHIGNQEYFKTEFNVKNKEKGLLSFKTKRNLITNSSEFYNLSYEYINDCLRAGLVYRREFYNDSELEPEDSLMFKLTLVPFGSLDGPRLEK